MTDLDPCALAQAVVDAFRANQDDPRENFHVELTPEQAEFIGRAMGAHLNQASQSVPGSEGVERARRLAKDIEIDCDGLLEPEQVASLADEIRGNAQLILAALQPVEREDERLSDGPGSTTHERPGSRSGSSRDDSERTA